MKDLKLNSSHDLDITNFDLSLINELDYVRQKLAIRLQFFYGEYIYDTSKGVKYYDYVYIKNPDLDLVSDVLKATILDTTDVNEITEFELDYDPSARSMTVNFTVDTSYGTLTNTVEV